jgi:thiosulfate/3-mercaptopyruvate sulfurtransferase
MGHEAVAVLDGGIQNWQKCGLPLTPRLPKLKKNQFRCYLDSKQWLNSQEVENGLAENAIVLLDARDTERFKGHFEPIDKVSGHVPKALNRPYRLNLSENGQFLVSEQLHVAFKPLVDSLNGRYLVHMCGSGVTACHNQLAMEIAGFSGSKLYAGSWSEWIVNQNRGVSKN